MRVLFLALSDLGAIAHRDDGSPIVVEVQRIEPSESTM